MPGKPPPPQPKSGRPVESPTRRIMRITTSDNKVIDCEPEPFSSGSEGRLFNTLDGNSVVKLYNRPEAWRQKSLATIIKKREAVLGDNPTYWARYFCWPESLVIQPGLGVLMPRARKDLRPFSQLLSPRFRQRIRQQEGEAALGKWSGHIGLLMKLARTVTRLHGNGLCHSDLSTNNLLVNPSHSDATLIDCDGLVETGSDILLPTVLGTPDYMAPELVMGLTPRPNQRPPQPSVTTDRHALAVLIYQGLLFRHPLRGSAFHSPDPDEDERLMLGRKALYIEHPTDRSNRPKTPFLQSAILGPEMQELFSRAFIDGLHHPEKRPYAAEWERALLRLYDQTLPCSNPACEAKTFVFVDRGSTRCPWCRTDVKGPRQIPILFFYKPDGKNNSSTFTLDFRFVGWPKRTLHAWHVEVNRLPGPGVEAAPYAAIQWEVQRAGEVWSLQNLTMDQCFDITEGKTRVPIATQGTIELREGMRLLFGGGDRARVVEVRMHKL